MNNWSLGKSGVNTDLSSLEPVVQHSISTPSPSIVLVLDISATMEYQVCTSTRCVLLCPAQCQAFNTNNSKPTG
jgi:hypothetical protein